jgi:hypothetical protein
VLWAGFAAFVAGLALIPPVAHRDEMVMLPWEVLALGALPILGRSLSTLMYTLRVAALALAVAVELHVFTTVEMTPWFAVLFVAIATTATAGVWAVVQWLSDIYLGTAFIHSEHRLMWDFVAAIVIGGMAGVVFQWYFRRFVRVETRLPSEVSKTEVGANDVGASDVGASEVSKSEVSDREIDGDEPSRGVER